MKTRPFTKPGRGFSPGQQGEYRTLVAVAWMAHCKREGLPVTPKRDEDWYQRELYLATGHETSSDCNAGRDYDLAMAHFEGLAGTSIKWQMKVYSGDVRRMMHGLRADLGEKALREARVDEAYLLRAIRQGFGGRKPWEVEREDLITVMGEVKRAVRRSIRHAQHIAEDKRAAMGELWEGDQQKVKNEPEVPF